MKNGGSLGGRLGDHGDMEISMNIMNLAEIISWVLGFV
jgi:hypothetical protein